MLVALYILLFILRRSWFYTRTLNWTRVVRFIGKFYLFICSTKRVGNSTEHIQKEFRLGFIF